MNKKVLLALVGMSALYWWVMKGQKQGATKSTFADVGNGVTVDSLGQWWKGGQIIYAPRQEWTA